jgi:hypothetical protein
VEILVLYEAWAHWHSIVFAPGLGRPVGVADFPVPNGVRDVPNGLLAVVVLLCIVVAVMVVHAYRLGNASLSLYLLALVISGVAMLGGAVLARIHPEVECQYCVSGCESGPMFGSDPDGPSRYSTRQCSSVNPTGYERLSTEQEKVSAWLDDGRSAAIAVVAIGSLTASMTVVVWLLDRRRSTKAGTTSG